jgi:hypothetical protein
MENNKNVELVARKKETINAYNFFITYNLAWNTTLTITSIHLDSSLDDDDDDNDNNNNKDNSKNNVTN